MSMSLTSHNEHERHFDGLRSFVSVIAVATLSLLALPLLALGISYLAGGLATSTLLFAYVLALITNVPFLLAALAIMCAFVSASRFVAKHAELR